MDIKTDFTIRRFIDTLVPGFIVITSLWYLYRPYINKYFPLIAFAPSQEGLFEVSNELKLVLILIASVFTGVIVNHFADVPVALMYKRDDKNNNKDWSTWDYKFKYAIIRFLDHCLLFRFFIWKDPRKKAMDRYAISPRKDSFNAMIHSWANTTIAKMKIRKEEIIIHEHICVKVRTMNPFTSKLFNDSYAEVIFASSLQVALIIVFFATLVLLGLNLYHDAFDTNSEFSLKFIANGKIALLLLAEYLLLLIMTYSVIRTFRHFSNHILTVAYHLYLNDKQSAEN